MHPVEMPNTTLPYSAARIAGNGARVLIADRSGSLLFWLWPDTAAISDEPLPLGPVQNAHGDGGPLSCVAGDLVSSGGWDPSVALWDGESLQQRYHLRPYDGRITAMTAQGNSLLVAGANRAPAPADQVKLDRVHLQPGLLTRIAHDGRSIQFSLMAKGQITALAAGETWLAAIDSGQANRLLYVRDEQPETLLVQDGPATALAAAGEKLYIATASGLWQCSTATSRHHMMAPFSVDSPRILFLQAIGQTLVGATSQGMIRWPDGRRFGESDRQPVDIARHGAKLLVLWEGGLLEQRKLPSGEITAAATVPTEM